MELNMSEGILENTDIVLVCHSPEKCIGEYCTMHNRSNHSMRSFPQYWRGDRGIMERTCPHGVGHPDPDDPKTTNWAEFVHGCDGCCKGAYDNIEIVKKSFIDEDWKLGKWDRVPSIVWDYMERLNGKKEK